MAKAVATARETPAEAIGPGLQRIIRQALAEAAGREHLTLTESAVRAARRPDMRASEALSALKLTE